MRQRLWALAMTAAAALPLGAGAQGTASGVKAAPRAAPAAAAPPAQTAIVELRGLVEVTHESAGAAEAVSAAPYALRPGDRLRIGPEASAKIRFADLSEVRLDGDTVFVVRQEDAANVSLFLAAGKLWAWVAKNRRRSFEVRTNAAVAAVRGTQFSVAAGANSAVTEVYEGAVAVNALRAGLPVGREALLLPGQRVEAKGGALGGVRSMVGPPRPADAKPKTKAQLEKDLKDRLASAEARKDADQAAAIQGALASGDESKMAGVAGALRSATEPTAAQKAALEKAFGGGRSLSDLAEAGRRGADAAMAKWNVHREIGLQMQQQMSRTAQAQGALSAAPQASNKVAMAAFQQQYQQSYLGAQQTVLAPAGAGAIAPTMTATVAPVTSVANATPAPTNSGALSPLNPTLSSPAPNLIQPGSGGCIVSCVAGVCLCK